MKDVTPRKAGWHRGYTVKPRSWDELARFYRDLGSGEFAAIVPLVEALASSPAAHELWAYTSVDTLCISDSVEHRADDSTLRITYRPSDQKFEFHHHSFSGHDDGATCSGNEALQTLRNFLKYKFGVLLDVP